MSFDVDVLTVIERAVLVTTKLTVLVSVWVNVSTICTVFVTEVFVVDIKKMVEVTFIGSEVVILVFSHEPQEMLVSFVRDLHFPLELSITSVFVV